MAPAVVYAEEIPETTIIKSPYLTLDEIEQITNEMAKKFGVKSKSLLETIKCEAPKTSTGLFDPTAQSLFKDSQGVRENSWGVTQINLTAHPEVSKAQATDARWSIEWTAKQFSLGHASMWTCWRQLKDSGII